MQPDVKPQLPTLRGVAPPQKKRTWCALLTYACILQICSLALLTFIIYVVIYRNGSDSGFPSQAANIVDRLEDCASRINLLAAYILPLANNSSLQNHSHIQQNVFLRARNLPHGTALLMPQSGHLRDVMSDIAFRFGDHEDRLATLRVTGSHDLLFQIKQFRNLQEDVARVFSTPTRAHYTALARNSRAFAQRLSRNVGHYLAEVDAFEEALVRLHDAMLRFSADLLHHTAVLRATIEAKGLVHQWAARLPVGDPDARALRTLMAAAAQVAQLYADIPRWDHLQEVRRILEGLRVTGLWLEQEISLQSGSRFPDQPPELSAQRYEESVNHLIDRASGYWDLGKR